GRNLRAFFFGRHGLLQCGDTETLLLGLFLRRVLGFVFLGRLFSRLRRSSQSAGTVGNSGDGSNRRWFVLDVGLVARFDERAILGRRHLLDLGNPLLRFGVRRKEPVFLGLILVAVVQSNEEVAERSRGIADFLRQIDRDLISIELVAAVEVVFEHHLVRPVCELVEKRGPIRQGLFGSLLN